MSTSPARPASGQVTAAIERHDDWTVIRVGAEPAPEDWWDRCRAAAERCGPGTAIVAKRIDEPGGRLVAMGADVVHPKGVHAIGRGRPATSERFPLEVDGTLDGLVFAPRGLAEGLEVPSGALGLLSVCLELRRRGGRVVAIPEVVAVGPEQALVVSPEERERFLAQFGFDPLAPDLAAIAADRELAGLRRTPRWFAAAQPFEKYRERGPYHWVAYAEHAAFRTRADLLVEIAVAAVAGTTRPVLDIGCGDGLFAHLLAARGIDVLAFDDDRTAVELATAQLSSRGTAKTTVTWGSVLAPPIDPGGAGGAVLFDVLEHLPNPAPALRAIRTALAPGAALVVSTPEATEGGSSDAAYHVCEYAADELARLVTACGFRVLREGRIGGPYRDLVLVATR